MPAGPVEGWVGGGAELAVGLGSSVARRVLVGTGACVGARVWVEGAAVGEAPGGCVGAAVGRATGLPIVHAISAMKTNKVAMSRRKLDMNSSRGDRNKPRF